MNTDIQHETAMAAGHKPKLLVADDSVTIRKVVELTFADEGIEVTAVSGGEEAMQKFVAIEPDIVLLDVNMPDPTGYQICEMIKGDEATRHIPVVLLVGSFEPFDQDEAERVGADGFVVKPFQSIRDLVGRVRDLLGPDKEPVVAVPETADIDSLIESSFAETRKMDAEPDTADVYLGDAGMDDEIIEMFHPESDHARTQPYAENDPDMLDYDIEPFPPLSEATADEDDLALAGLDWAARPADEIPEPANDEPAPPDPVPAPAESHDGQPDEQPHQDAPALDLDEVDTLRDIDVAAEKEGREREHADEPSDEFITLVARRVVEKLSDRVIREIAKDAVPRIAEQLIREALEEEHKG